MNDEKTSYKYRERDLVTGEAVVVDLVATTGAVMDESTAKWTIGKAETTGPTLDNMLARAQFADALLKEFGGHEGFARLVAQELKEKHGTNLSHVQVGLLQTVLGTIYG